MTWIAKIRIITPGLPELVCYEKRNNTNLDQPAIVCKSAE